MANEKKVKNQIANVNKVKLLSECASGGHFLLSTWCGYLIIFSFFNAVETHYLRI